MTTATEVFEGTFEVDVIHSSLEAGTTHMGVPPTTDFYGSVRAALDLTTTIDRRDFGLDWQQPLPGGGNALEWEVTTDAHLEFIKT